MSRSDKGSSSSRGLLGVGAGLLALFVVRAMRGKSEDPSPGDPTPPAVNQAASSDGQGRAGGTAVSTISEATLATLREQAVCNLQRLRESSVRREDPRRRLVWRMSSYERRRLGNADRGRVSHGSAHSPITSLDSTRLTRENLVQLVLPNDHYMTMEFGITVLREVFMCSDVEAAELMLQVHRGGRAVIGKYPGKIAQARAKRVTAMAAKAEFPLRCTVEALPGFG